MVLGSSDRAQVRIAHRSVSRFHAELEPADGGVSVRDLDSQQRTFVNGVQVSAARAPDGATLRLGEIELRIDYARAEMRAVSAWRFDAFGKLVGATQSMRELFARLSRLSPTDAPVLVRGETGTGKELVARAIHDASPRSRAPFLVVDCAALPETLLEAELYGHARGAFTGAANARPGVFEAAEGGTVFLDEIGELPVSLQPKLLRVLESRTVRRIGETAHRPVDVRFVAATHRDLLGMVNAQTFREDLYFRLAVFPVYVPALRDRVDDIPLLVQHMLPEDKHRLITAEAVARLKEMPWRGNVRELRNFLDRAKVLGLEGALGMHSEEEERRGVDGIPPSSRHIPVSVPSSADLTAAPESDSLVPSSRRDTLVSEGELASLAVPAPERAPDPGIYDLVYKDFREQWIDHGEREYIRRRLARHEHNVSAVARDAELARAYIYRLMKKHGL